MGWHGETPNRVDMRAPLPVVENSARLLGSLFVFAKHETKEEHAKYKGDES
jgi:hypothetical protein